MICMLRCKFFANLKKFLQSGFRATLNFWKFKVGVFKGKTVAIVTNDLMKMTTTYSAMIGHLFDSIIVAATDKDL